MSKIFDELFKIAQLEGYSGSPWIAADMVGQEQLYQIQEEFTIALHTAAGKSSANHKKLAETFPYFFKLQEKE